MDKNTKLALGLTLAGVLYIQHWNTKELRRKHNQLVRQLNEERRRAVQAQFDRRFNRIVADYDR